MSVKKLFAEKNIETKYLHWLTLIFIVSATVLSYIKFPLSSFPFGDEPSYCNETQYLLDFGLYASLSQGTSFFMSILIAAVSKISGASLIVSGRILSVILYFVTCGVLYKCLQRFKGVSTNTICYTVMMFGIISFGWIWRCLADIGCMLFCVSALYFLLGERNKKNIALSALMIMIAFGIRPTALFFIPGLIFVLFFIDRFHVNLIGRIKSVVLFCFVFISLFSLYHIPGYLQYNKLMLEDKNHVYTGEKRVELLNNWDERKIYYEVYNVNNRWTVWYATWEEVAEFKKLHPEINLRQGHLEYPLNYPTYFFKNLSYKLFLYLPYSIQSPFFFSKWTVVNRFVKNFNIIMGIALLLVSAMYFVERKWLVKNMLLLAPALIYYTLLSIYEFGQQQANWVMLSDVFLIVPVAKMFADRVNFFILVILQLVFLLLM